MTTFYVLLIVFHNGYMDGGVGVLQQEFTALAACEAARAQMTKTPQNERKLVWASGCFNK